MVERFKELKIVVIPTVINLIQLEWMASRGLKLGSLSFHVIDMAPFKSPRRHNREGNIDLVWYEQTYFNLEN